jgi:hypothetical protein
MEQGGVIIHAKRINPIKDGSDNSGTGTSDTSDEWAWYFEGLLRPMGRSMMFLL